jgi:hypothetical protein
MPMSAIGLPAQGRNFVMSATGYHHSHLVFERQQSLEMRGMAWEGRIQPLTSWSVLILRGAGAFALAVAMLAVAI